MHGMGTRAMGTAEIQSWEEEPYDEPEGGPKLARVRVTNAFRGDIEGEGTLTYLMAYGTEGAVTFVGLERVVGRLGGRSGSFVLQHRGTFAGEAAWGDWSVVPGSGTGELRGLRGEGGFVAQHGERAELTTWYAQEPSPPRVERWGLEYELD
jgi:hypothetical protein